MSAALIQKQFQLISDEFSLYCVTASEIEFYLEGSQGDSQLDAFWTEIREQCAENGIAIDKTDKEKGLEQFEISLKPSNSPAKTALDTKLLKEIVQLSFYQNPLMKCCFESALFFYRMRLT